MRFVKCFFGIKKQLMSILKKKLIQKTKINVQIITILCKKLLKIISERTSPFKSITHTIKAFSENFIFRTKTVFCTKPVELAWAASERANLFENFEYRERAASKQLEISASASERELSLARPQLARVSFLSTFKTLAAAGAELRLSSAPSASSVHKINNSV